MDQADLLSLCRVKGASWYFIAREAQRPGGLERLLAGQAAEDSAEAHATLDVLAAARDHIPAHTETVREMIASTEGDGIRLTTVLADDYPVNLRVIENLPPFLFYRGDLHPDDAYSVAVVGTRSPSAEGVARARRMASLLAQRGVTVLSGLARGIDTAAHEACLES